MFDDNVHQSARTVKTWCMASWTFGAADSLCLRELHTSLGSFDGMFKADSAWYTLKSKP